MRFHQLLLEFDLTKTLQKFGERIADKLEHDIGFHTDIQIQGIDRFTTAKAHTAQRGYGYHHKRYEKYVRNLEATIAIEKFMAADPTANKKYAQWICQRYVDNGIIHGEDLTRVHNALAVFDQVKNSGYFRRNPEQAQLADINRFDGLHALEAFLDSLPKEAEESKAYQDRKALTEAKVLYDDAKYKIVIPQTIAAATAYGRNTKWCTTSENGSAFDSYTTQGPLYIIIEKAKNRRWQFHFESGQFMDANDQPVYWDWFPDEIWGLIEWPWSKLSEANQINFLANGTPTMIENIKPRHGDVLIVAAIMAKDEETETLIKNKIKTAIPAQPDKTWSLGAAKLHRFEDQKTAFAFDLKRFKTSGIWVNSAVLEVSRAAEPRRQHGKHNYGAALSRFDMIDVAYVLDAPGMKRQYIFVYSSREQGLVVGITTARLKDDIHGALLNNIRTNLSQYGVPARNMEANPIWEDVMRIVLKEVE